MNLQQHIRHGLLSLSLITGGMVIAPASFAHDGHHHGGGGHDHHHHYYHRHVRDGVIAGLAAGAIIGGIAIAASNSSSTTYYGPSCRRVSYARHCHFNRWGDRVCYRQRFVSYNC